jgi:hypothetical protein
MSSAWPFGMGPEPQWFKDQRARWDELERKGWRFSKPDMSLAESRDAVRLVMEKGDEKEDLKLYRGRKFQEFQEIHTRMLEMAEGVAGVRV